MIKGKLVDNFTPILASIIDDERDEFSNVSCENLQQKKTNIGDNLTTLKADNIKRKTFQKFTVRDIVFLGIISAVLILSCGIMPLVVELTKIVFGIAQLVTSLQISLFVTIGLIKVRKPFSLTLILIFMGAIMVMMAPIMFLSNIFVAVVIELIVIVVFRGYQSKIACFTAGMLTGPLSLPVYIVYNYITAPEIFSAITGNIYIVIGVTFAIVVISAIGAGIGLKIGNELNKAGVMKKNGKI